MQGAGDHEPLQTESSMEDFVIDFDTESINFIDEISGFVTGTILVKGYWLFSGQA